MENKRKTLLLFVVIAALLFCMPKVSYAGSNVKIQAQNTNSEVVKGPHRRLLTFVDCGAKCKVRCSLHSRPKICTRACGTCCLRCNCVPPGTYGNREMCGKCYTDMITHGNKPKCP
ncbi:gibberellin-regulated protein 1-like [Abrus precatorius]|uniref:Gibberellin-regulated protein 1-like n=1 Tax=Abrus precatorius TaxID=3816 RepID=A0A8B8KZG5_ABRPR|nr:gibberellin-regulated protein 1-like [Abrus precatorius]